LLARLRRHHLQVFALLWLPYALLVWRFWFVTEDAFISFRYARNLALGHGLRYHLGHAAPVEGYSNFLWLILAACIERLGEDAALWMPILSTLCGTLLLFLLFDWLGRRQGGELLVAGLGTLALGCTPPFALWSSGGLETVPFALLVFLTFERLVLREGGPT
jgi:arabinofuranosyltransferase